MVGLQFDDTLGAMSIGFSVSCAVFGVLTTQVFVYFNRYRSDRLVYKILVSLIWLIELVDQAFIGYAVYYYTITNFAAPLVLLQGNVLWALIVQILLGALVGAIVKCCYAMRVWRFSNKNIWWTGVILIITAGQFGLAIGYSVRAFQLNKFVYADRLKTTATLALASGVFTDFITAAALCYYLRKLRTGYKKSDTLVNSLTRYAINTGVVTSVISLLTLALYNAKPKSLYFMGVYFVLGKLYAVSLLCTLNTRKITRGRGTDREGGTTSMTSGRGMWLMVTSHREGQGHIQGPQSPQALSDRAQDQRSLQKYGRSQSSHPGSYQYTYPSQTKSVEIGVHQEVSVVTDQGQDMDLDYYQLQHHEQQQQPLYLERVLEQEQMQGHQAYPADIEEVIVPGLVYQMPFTKQSHGLR